MMKLFPFAVLSAAIFLSDAVHAECCRAVHEIKHMGSIFYFCGDWTPRKVGCCAYGPCNIFCCNCDGGCRGERRRNLRDVLVLLSNQQTLPPTPVHASLAPVNEDICPHSGEPKMSLEEFRVYAESRDVPEKYVQDQIFDELDVDKDGYIASSERCNKHTHAEDIRAMHSQE